ncbi:MAG: SMC-Scp complex subunit ScpB, partial [Chloroflexi bacterium]|nr:SMC-Scp complex subunit ScpB [Chloroflexota bacterium]
DLDRILEALLFVADGPVSIEELAKAAQAPLAEVEAALQRLIEAPPRSGLCIVRQGSHVQMVTAPEAAPAVERLLGLDRSARLSNAALETLAIIAYRQPVTRAQIEAIRGVNSDAVIRSLLAKSLIQPVGRLEQAGRPELLGTTFEFLQYFGLKSLEELPPLPEPDGEDRP